MGIADQKRAAREFVERWRHRGGEKQDAQSFWNDLLENVLGIPSTSLPGFVSFERKVKGGFIDVFMEDVGVIVEHKGRGVDLEKPRRQSDGEMLTPYAQAHRYAQRLPHSIRPRWIVTCNFEKMLVYDQETDPTGDRPQEIAIEDLPDEVYRLSFITDKSNSRIERERDVSVRAGAIVADLYEKLSGRYMDIDGDSGEQHSLNVLIVRLVFLFYAEDAGLFQSRNAVSEYLGTFAPEQMRRAIKELFEILDTPEEERDPYAREDLLAFPYVNGGLFADADVTVPQMTQEIKDALIAAGEFDWSSVSPTVFGAVFESSINPETRRSGGMHYTSIENLHKAIDELFLDDLRTELEHIEGLKSERDRRIRLRAFQQKLAGINVIDPALGSGNFCTESYISLRKLENRAIEGMQLRDNAQLGLDGDASPVKVSISQFHGIEVNDFAVAVAKAAMWIAESQMAEATQEIVMQPIGFLPLSDKANFVCGNALRMDWNDVLPAAKASYIIGNPPFVGARMQSKEQKAELQEVFHGAKNSGNIDYVAGWYMKAAEYMGDLPIRAAFVSTNSICQGEQVANVWKPMYDLGIRIDFAYDTFRWRNEANDQAHVFVIIVGFSKLGGDKTLFHHADPDAEPAVSSPANINAYLSTAPDVFVWNRSKPLCDVPKIGIGSQPIDGGNYLFKEAEMREFIAREPGSERFFHVWLGSDEFLNNRPRYTLWLGDATPQELIALPLCRERIENVRAFREKSNRAQTKKAAATPEHYGTEIIASSTSILIPKVSSERRRYIPLGFIDPDTFCSDLVFLIPDATLYHFGVLHSQFHNAWMRVVAGRLKSDYRYSGGMVYNNFVWPEPDEGQRRQIEERAQAILDTRKLYPDASLATLYDPDKMPDDLRDAHLALDAAVEAAYGVDFDGDEEEIVAHLFKLYAEATAMEDPRA